MDLAHCSKSLFLGDLGGTDIKAEALATDADGARRDENDVVALVSELSDCFCQACKGSEVEGADIWIDEGAGPYFDDL